MKPENHCKHSQPSCPTTVCVCVCNRGNAVGSIMLLGVSNNICPTLSLVLNRYVVPHRLCKVVQQANTQWQALSVCLLLMLLLQVVDVVMQSAFSELDDQAVSLDPIIRLPCGHVFTTSTLDGKYRQVSVSHCRCAIMTM